MRAVKIAIAANSFVFILKLFSAVMTGSASMFAEAIHSFADTANQALLWIGLRRSKIGPSKEYPFGRGKEMFVWGLISACGIFFIGSGVTIYHGIEYLMEYQNPQLTKLNYIISDEMGEQLESIFYTHNSAPNLNLIVLLVSLVVESIPLCIAWIDKQEGNTANLAVILEDSVAVLGVVLAFIAIFLSKITDWFIWDGIGSIIIGILLGAVAIVLIKKNLEYLMEKSSPEELKEEVKEELEKMPLIEDIKDIRMIILTPTTHHIRAEVEINGYLLVKEMEDTLRDEYEEIKNYSEFLRFCSTFANRITRIVGSSIDKMEDRIKKKITYIKSVDIKPS